jgi:hypothetical protein
VNPNAIVPHTTGWYGRFRIMVQPEKEFLDREAHRRNEGTTGFTGIRGIVMRDAAVTSSMGLIYDRRREHLGTSDAIDIRSDVASSRHQPDNAQPTATTR